MDTSRLTCIDAVRAVIERSQAKCIQTGESNMEILSIVPKRAPVPDDPPRSHEELVLVCKKVARDIKRLDLELRNVCFT